LSLWVLMGYNLRVALLGNPLLQHVTAAPEGLLLQLDGMAAAGDPEPPSTEAAAFLHGFIRRFLLAMVMLILELGLLGRLFWIDVLPWLAFGLLAKDLVIAAAGGLAAHSLASQPGMFSALRFTPRWACHLDRLSSLLSGLGVLAILVHLAHT
jgi:hypothetical protein